MAKVVAINGSPRMEKGDTAMVLAPFIQGMTDAGADVELFYASRLNVHPCACGQMFCWYGKPGECVYKDDMQMLLSKISQAEILVLATPVYIPLPGDMQKVINRLCPLLEPKLETRDGRTRGRMREHVKLQRVALVVSGGWWEKANSDTVVRIAEEFAKDGSLEFAGAVVRPHAFVMRPRGELTEDGEGVLDMANRAGRELIEEGAMKDATLDAVSRPLISEERLKRMYNKMV